VQRLPSLNATVFAKPSTTCGSAGHWRLPWKCRRTAGAPRRTHSYRCRVIRKR